MTMIQHRDPGDESEAMSDERAAVRTIIRGQEFVDASDYDALRAENERLEVIATKDEDSALLAARKIRELEASIGYADDAFSMGFNAGLLKTLNILSDLPAIRRAPKVGSL